MTFDLENAVQQGFNRDITTNDFNVESNNLEVVLGIAENGVSINDTAMFMVKDGYNIPVLISRFDGYFSVRGPAEVHGGHVLVKGTITNSGFVTLEDNTDETSIFLFDSDPDGVVVGTKGSFGTSYNDGYLYINVDDNTGWKRVALRSELDEIPTATHEPSGFEKEAADSTITFVDATRLFTIVPKGASYNIYLVGQRVTIGDSRIVTITDIEGMHFIYFDYVDSQLKQTMTFSEDIITKDAFVAAIYWDSTNKRAIYFGDERHGIVMDGATHLYLHETFGTRWVSGLALGSFSYGNGSADVDAEFAVTNGLITDEDFPTAINDGLPQELDPIANIPIYYKTGATPYWRVKDPDTFPLIYTGTVGYAGTRLPYNQYTGGAWQLTEAPANNNYVLMHYFATNNLVNDGSLDAYGNAMIGVLGQSVHSTLASASDAAKSEINVLYQSGLPFKEFRPIATVVFQTSALYANTPKGRIVSLPDGSDYVDWRTEVPVPGIGVSVSDHGNLTGLLDDDHPQYLRTDGTRKLSAPWDAADIITTPQIRSDVELKLDGELGIVLDGYGNNVIPRESCTDSLGDTTHGWLDIYLCNGGNVIGLNDPGDPSSPNTTSGAELVGTNSQNFITFGPTMSGDTVQSALEAIDGYFIGMTTYINDQVNSLTWQDIYDNSCASETVVTNSTCGSLVFSGTENVSFTNDGGVTVTNDLTVGGDLTVNGTTTNVNTQDLFVEDRMIRLNVGAIPSFNGTTGFEAEVGSDGYVEFHWDDTLGRWEFSIDRNTVPGAETFRPIPYLAASPGTLDLSSVGTGGYPTLGPNPDAGASVINTNKTNFPYTFGPLMTNDSVQAALEAIDGYFLDLTAWVNGEIGGLTLQDIINNSCPNPTVDLTCGDLTFNGPGELVFNTPTNITQEVNIYGGGPVNINVSGDINIDGYNVVINSTNTSTINGENGIILDGYGNNVIPMNSCTDSLGDATHGWTDIFICHDGYVIGLNDPGDASAHNNFSGAELVGTNSTNFTNFGPLTSNTVQSALEAIDVKIGVIDGEITTIQGDILTIQGDITNIENEIDGLTLQTIYNQSCPNPVLNLTCGDLTINGPSNLVVTTTIEGTSGLVLTGDGYNVIPETSCTDSLGDPTHGWTDIYLCSGSNVIGLNDTGDAGVPNTESGAYVVGTNSLNFTTFGPDMTSNTVQAALEAIDGYLADIVSGSVFTPTFQDIYDASCPNPTIDLTCGDLTFNGPGNVVITTGVEISGNGPVVIDITGDTNISSGGDTNIFAGDQVTISGTNGVVIDGYGNNVIPATSCSDSLGDATHGWTDIFICHDGYVIGLNDVGDASVHNNLSGADLVGTNSDNFETFGPTMTEDNVQSALEAIDGYMKNLGEMFGEITLQDIINNSCPNPTVALTCGDLTINGPGELVFNTPTNISQEVNIYGGGPVNINVSGDINLDGYNVVINSTNTSTINGANGIILDGYGNNVIPMNSCTDSLGDATHGWTDIYVCHDGYVIGLSDVGDTTVHNNLSGADLVGTNSDNFETFGPAMTEDNVQSALEAIDGYLKDLSLEALDTTYTKTCGLDINGAVLNGVVKVASDAGTPALDFNWTQTSRASWSIPVPSDWDGASDITVTVVWSAQDGSAGNVEWRLEYKSLSLTELASSAASTDDYMQAASGTTDAIQSTGTNLSIPASAISTSDEIIVINIVRRGNAGTDSYENNAQVHLVKYSYKAQNIV